MISKPDPNEEGTPVPATRENVFRLNGPHDVLLTAAQEVVRDTTRLTRLFTILSESSPLELKLDRVLSTLSELFASDIVVLVDPAGSGSFSPLAAIGLPEDVIRMPMSDTGYVAVAMTTGTSIVKKNVSQDASVEPQFRELGTETAVWIPVIGSHSPRGVLILARCDPTPFTPADIDLLTAMAYRIGLTLDQAQRSVQLEQIIRAGRKITCNLNESAVCKETVGMLPPVVGADAAVLVLNDAGGIPQCVAQFGIDPCWSDKWCRLTEHLLADPQIDNVQPYTTSDLHAAVQTSSLQPMDGLPVRALLVVPVHREKRIQGLLFAMRFSTTAFGPDTIQVAMLYASQASAALENAWLYQTVQQELAVRVRAEHRLLESEERLQLALMGADLGMWDWNVVSGEVRFNERWSGMLGYKPEEIEPHVREREKRIHPEDRPHVKEALQSHLEGRTSYYETEHRFLAKSGKWIWVLDKGKVTHRDAHGHPLRFIGTCLDITEAKQIQADRFLIEQQKHHVRRVESLSCMAGGIAHHFNNQLQAVMGNLEMAIMDLPQESDTIALLSEAMKASHRAAEVSSLMLTYLGQTPGKQELLDLSEACRVGLSKLGTDIPNNVIIASEFSSPGPTVRANLNQMQKVLTNLATNAWESICNIRGNIRLAVKAVFPEDIPALHRFPVDWQPKSIPHACMEVADTGGSIADKDIEKIFDPFFTTKFTGRGLGLPVVMGIVGAHGGGITVESEPGRGSVFRVFLPISAEKAPFPQTKPVPASTVEESGTVLLIEDEEQVRTMGRMMLDHLGYGVLEARDGVEAVEIFLIHRNAIRCVLSDLTMPRMDGWETLTALRNLSPDIPVILSSGYDETQVMAGDHPERPNAFLGKPYQLNGLRETIRRVLNAQERPVRVIPQFNKDDE
jgi:PAS domain S-box-containing protein